MDTNVVKMIEKKDEKMMMTTNDDNGDEWRH